MDALLYQNEVPVASAKSAENPGISCAGVGGLPKAYHFEDKAKTVPDLIALSGALDTLISVISGIGSGYKFQERNGALNAAGSELDDITDLLVDRHCEVMLRLREAEPKTSQTAEDRGCELLAWDLQCDQNATDVALAAVRKAFPGRY